MHSITVSFKSSQFNRIFPFYILINEDLVVESYGKTLEKLFPGIVGKPFFDNLHFQRPELPNLNFDSLDILTNQVVIIECRNTVKTILRGQIELLPATKQALFIGSPWFGSMEEVIQNNLRLDDFAYHDPMIDLLHLLKTQEITTDELKKLLQTINRQKNDLKSATKQIQDIALFPMQNPDPLIRINLSGKILKLNPAAEKLTEFIFENKNYTAEEFWFEIAGRIDINKEREIIEVKSGGRWLSFVIKPLPDDGYYNIYGRDVTVNKEREDQLLILSSIAAENTNGVVIADKEGKIEWVNRSFEEMTGYSISELVGKKPGVILQGADTNPETVTYLKKQVKNGDPFITEILNYHKSGKPYWLRVQGQALKDRTGNIIKYFAIEEDITIEKETQEKLKQFESRFRIALEKLGDNVWEYDFRTDQTVFSNAHSHFLGYDFDDKTSNDKLWWDRVYKEDLNILTENNYKIRNKMTDHYALEYRMYHADGSLRWVLDRGVVIEKDIDGRPVKIIGTHTDVTSQKEIEQALVDAKNNAEASSRLKESFLANMSHEIRTPLNAVIGMIRELTREKLSPKQSLYIKNAALASQHLLSIVNDILDISKIESGQMALSKRPFNLKEVILDATTILRPSAREKMLKLTEDTSPMLAPAYIGDSHRIRQILLNVITNAIKFTDEGGVTIQSELVGVENDHHHIRIRVMDTGIGMDESFVNHIFDKFSQDEQSAGRKYGGTGLGLAIVKELVNLMNGNIHVSSSAGKGTTVEINIYLKLADEDEVQIKHTPESYSTLKDKNILLVEDNDLNRMVTENLLTFYGVRVTQVVNGIEAIWKLKESPFDVVLMDLQMPHMGGMEATEIIRKELEMDIPIIALTANAFKAELDRCMAVGMNDYITKPYEENVLLEAILKCLPKAESNIMVDEEPQAKEKLYNLDYLLQFTRGNNELIGKLIHEFVVQTPKAVEEIKEALTAGDLKTIRALAHKIKSNIDIFGISGLKTEIRKIESLAGEDQETPELKPLIDRLDDIVKKVVNDLVMEKL